MKAFEIPSLSQEECEKIVAAEHLCRIAFHGEHYPYLAPFLYVWQNNHLYFLSANYGAKIKYFRDNPLVVVEIDTHGLTPVVLSVVLIGLMRYMIVMQCIAWSSSAAISRPVQGVDTIYKALINQ